MERLGVLLLCLTVAIGLGSVGAGAGEKPEGELCIPVGTIDASVQTRFRGSHGAAPGS